MIRSRASTLIARELDHVFRFVSIEFFDNYPRWSPEVVELRRLSPGPLRVGTRGRQVRIDHGRRTESTFHVVDLAHAQRICFASLSRPRYHVAYHFEAEGDHTRVSLSFELRPELFLRPFERLIREAVHTGTRRTVGNLKRVLESERPALASA